MVKRSVSIAVVLVAGIAACAAVADEPHPRPAARGPAEATPRELLELFGIDEGFFAAFRDDEPVDADEQEKLYALMYRLRRIPRRKLEEFRMPVRLVLLADGREGLRGEIMETSGFVKRVTREELPAEAREKFGFAACYRCEMVSHWGANLVIYTLQVPSQWELDAPISERAGALSMFVKVARGARSDDPSDEAAREKRPARELLFVADRLSWFPESLLGSLGMDFGLFEQVRDRTGLEGAAERECFYEMLAAVRYAEAGRIERAGRTQLAERHDFLERLVRNRETGPKRRAQAERALARAKAGADDVVPLFNDPEAQRGKLFVLPGTALRAIEIRIDDPQIVGRYGFDRYYEVEIVTADSQNNPLVCCVAELPPGMPLGDAIHQNVRVTGFFMKSWAFDTAKAASAKQQKQLAPLLFARSLELLAEPEVRASSTWWAIGLGVAIVLLAAVAWLVKRGDRRARQRIAEAWQGAPPDRWSETAGESR